MDSAAPFEMTLIIPAYNEEAHIGPCLESAIRNSKGKFQEVIVVDNGSTDKTAQIAGRYPGVRVVSEPRRGTGHARQTGFEHAHGDIIAYADADTRMPEGWVDIIEEVFNRDQGVVLLSGPYRFYESARYPLWVLNAVVWTIPVMNALVGYFATAGNCAMRREALQKIGGHDRSFFFYGDDVDLARRLHDIGKTLWLRKFYMNTSARRFDEKGILAACSKYALNYCWHVMFRRPFHPGYDDIKRS